jgi:hypothetical protein
METYKCCRLEGLLEMVGLPCPGERLEYTDEAEDVAEALCYEPLTKDDVEWTYPENFTRVNTEAIVEETDDDPILDRGPEFGMATFDEIEPTLNQQRFTDQARAAVDQASMRRQAEALAAEHQANEQRAMEDADAPPVTLQAPFPHWNDVVIAASQRQGQSPRVFQWNPPGTNTINDNDEDT